MKPPIVKLPEVDGYYWMKNIAGEEACNNFHTVWRVVSVFKSPDRNLLGQRVARDGTSIYTADYLADWKEIEFVGPIEPPNQVWKPIATAPKDGAAIILWWRYCKHPAVGRWFDADDENREGWRCDGDECVPKNQKDCTHWMPLPKPPTL